MKKHLLVLACLLGCMVAVAQINVTFNINSTAGTHAISPLIFGSNGQGGDWDANITGRRLGGNRLTGYNWENNYSNAGTDYLNESDDYLPYALGLPNNEYLKPNAVYNAFHDTSLAMHCYTVLTLPMAGYVAADGAGVVNNADAAPSYRWKAVVNQKGSAFSLIPDTNDAYVYVDECLNNMVQHYGLGNSATGVKAYQMDNEWALWNTTHPLLHPAQPSCGEVFLKSENLAKTIKIMDSTAEVFGPADYGYASFQNFQNAVDFGAYSSYGNFLNAYLNDMKQASNTFGKRLLDVLDVHWYPEAQGMTNTNGLDRVTNGSTDPGVAIARMQCPRTLWDSSYVENSWIGQYFSPCTYLIALKNGVRDYYPGTRIGFTEFDYGAANHISGGIATADVLGIFAKYDVYFSSHWGGLTGYLAQAYKIYRNYDGRKSTFGDTYVQSNTSNIVNSSVYASVESADSNVMHIIVMNKNYDSTLVSNFSISSPITFDTLTAWGFDSIADTITNRGTLAIAGNQFAFTVPPLSVYHLILHHHVAAPTGVAVVNKDFEFSIYPNPAHQTLNITTGINRFTYSIVDITGQQILTGATVQQIDISTLAPGMFFMEATDAATGAVVVRRFVRE